jgi:predicted exporter
MTASVLADLTKESEALEIDTWLEDPVSQQFRNLWLDVGTDQSASIVLLNGLQDTLSLREALADFPSVVVANKAEEMSSLFGQYRERVSWVLAAAYAIILLGLATRYGLRQAVVLLIPPVFAGALALIIISVLGNSLNLFNFLAMILVLGIGIDFTLFLAEARGDRRITMFAITLSALTTMLSFGLLSLSSTFAVHSFGITVLIGIACAYLLSPLAVFERTRLPAE